MVVSWLGSIYKDCSYPARMAIGGGFAGGGKGRGGRSGGCGGRASGHG